MECYFDGNSDNIESNLNNFTYIDPASYYVIYDVFVNEYDVESKYEDTCDHSDHSDHKYTPDLHLVSPR